MSLKLPRWQFAVTCALAALVTGCQCPNACGTHMSWCPFDAALDPDAGPDAAVRRDGGRDAGGDAGRDAGPPGPAGWAHFADLPEDCAVELAAHPENVIPHIEWTGCGEGCQRWAGERMGWMRWPTGVPGRVWVNDTAPGYTHSHLILLDLQRGPLLALREALRSPWCILDGVAADGDHVAVAVHHWESDESGTRVVRSWTRYYRGLVDEMSRARLVLHDDDLPDTVDRLAVSPTRMAAQSVGAFAWAIDDDGTLTLASRPFYPNPVQELHLVGDDVLWTDWGARIRLARAGRGEEATILHEVADGDVRAFTTDGETFAWEHAMERDPATGVYGRVELWTGTYDGARLSGRFVRELPSHDTGHVGGGLLVRPELRGDAEIVYAVYRLSDGAVAYVSTPDGTLPRFVVSVSATDILFEGFETVFRVDPRTLHFEGP